MSFAVNTIDVLILIGAAQGFFLCVLIFHQYKRPFANRFLGAMTLIYALILVNLFLNDINAYGQAAYLSFVFSGLGLLNGPLHYLYARYLTIPADKVNRKHYLHGLPFIFFEAAVFFMVLSPGTGKLMEIGSKEPGLPAYFLMFNFFIILQGFIYLFITLHLLKRYALSIRNIFSSFDKIKLDWLKFLSWAVIGVLCFYTLENIFFIFGIDLTNMFRGTSLLFAVSVYLLAYFGLTRTQIFSNSAVKRSMREVALSSEAMVKKYHKSGLSAEKAERILKNLLQLMRNEAPYRNSDLTLNQLAGRLSVSPHYLSEIINTRLNKNFYDFINQYRLEGVKRDLSNPAKSHLTILALAFDAGFNSKTAFNIFFKKHTGMTPSEYRIIKSQNPVS